MTKTSLSACWTKETVREAVTKDEARLFAPWSIGRPEGWKTDTATKNVVCVGYWLDETLSHIATKEDRITQIGFFHRRSRSETDPFLIAAELLNEVIADAVPQNRIPHKRWG